MLLLGILVVFIEVAILIELMSVLVSLNLIRLVWQDAERELTLVVSGHLAGSCVYLIDVSTTTDLERYTLYGDARTTILYITGNLHARLHFQHDVLHHVLSSTGAEGNGLRTAIAIQACRDGVLCPCSIHIGQVTEDVVATLVGGCLLELSVRQRSIDNLTRDTCTIQEAEET